MTDSNLMGLAKTIQRIYRERLGGDPEDLVRVWDEGELVFVLKNDDTQAVVAVGDLLHDREDRIAASLEAFHPLD